MSGTNHLWKKYGNPVERDRNHMQEHGRTHYMQTIIKMVLVHLKSIIRTTLTLYDFTKSNGSSVSNKYLSQFTTNRLLMSGFP